MIAKEDLIRSGNFFCQDCGCDFDAPDGGVYCPQCGGERISECPEDADAND